MVMFDEKGRLILKYKPEIDREKDAKKWKKKLPTIYKKTCKQLNTPELLNVKNYEIEYDKTFPLWASIYMREQKIITGQKWHTLSDEEKEKVLEHEFTHAITGRHKHTRQLRGLMRGAGIPATFQDIREERER